MMSRMVLLRISSASVFPRRDARIAAGIFAATVLLAGLLGGVACSGAVPATAADGTSRGPPAAEYLVELNEDLSEFQVRACFPGAGPTKLFSNVTGIDGAIHTLRHVSPAGTRRLTQVGQEVSLGAVVDDACVDYTLDVATLIRRRSSLGRRMSGSLLLNGSALLLRPDPFAEDARVRVRFALPDGVAVGTPWLAGANDYETDASVYRFLSHLVFGTFARETVAVAGAQLDIVRLPGTLAAEGDVLSAWVRDGAIAAAALTGRFPVPRALIVLVPVPAGPDPIAFGNVGRGGGASVMLLVRANATGQTLLDDWVAPHEFSHLAVPYVRREDLWLSEGLATYYQHVLPVRSRRGDELTAWKALDDGFRRGKIDGTGRTLREECRAVFQTRAFARVYWTGTALALLADVGLRRRGTNLDAALRAVAAASRPPLRPLPGDELVDAIDAASDSDTLRTLVSRYIDSAEFPDLDETYTFLGLLRDPSGSVVALSDDAPGAALRRAIMAPRVPVPRRERVARSDPRRPHP